MSQSILDTRPGGLLRLGLRGPIWLFRLHLDPLLGDRFLLLIHTGRKSRLPRQTVIEVVQHDGTSDTYYVVSGWGEKSDWYRNIRQTPQVTVCVGGRKFQAYAEFISTEKAIGILETYAREHPTAFRELSGLFLGERLQPGSDAPGRLAQKMPMVAFHPGQSKDQRS
ncbi:MAG TPA: nitroreductase family deazaflavin-dependent oxidoreductase [Anaerolineales bacterium]|nr:nitroreductase family deazaflavin-dependent oxidoreductase [Anaerolineales bacterium]